MIQVPVPSPQAAVSISLTDPVTLFTCVYYLRHFTELIIVNYNNEKNKLWFDEILTVVRTLKPMIVSAGNHI